MFSLKLLGEGATDLEEIPYEVWLRDKLHFEKKAMESGFRTMGYGGQSIYAQHPHTRQTRKVSQVAPSSALDHDLHVIVLHWLGTATELVSLGSCESRGDVNGPAGGLSEQEDDREIGTKGQGHARRQASCTVWSMRIDPVAEQEV